jgi:transposase-like protein
LWENAWSEFVPFLDYDVEIRKIICSTNAIWVLCLQGWVGLCFPDQSWKRPALTLNAIDAGRLSWTRNVGLAV